MTQPYKSQRPRTMKQAGGMILEGIAKGVGVVVFAGWVLLQIWYAFTGFTLMPHRGSDGRCHQTTEYAFGFLLKNGPVPEDWCAD